MLSEEKKMSKKIIFFREVCDKKSKKKTLNEMKKRVYSLNKEDENMEINWQETGKKVKGIMRQKGYSLKKMADELYISESTMKNYIYAGTKIPLEILYRMQVLLEVEKIENLLVME